MVKSIILKIIEKEDIIRLMDSIDLIKIEKLYHYEKSELIHLLLFIGIMSFILFIKPNISIFI